MNRYCVKTNIDKVLLRKKKNWLLHQLDFELTERCNNNCIHCYINLPKDDLWTQKKELSTKEIKNIIRESASLGCMNVRFTGGEPLLRTDFEELYVFARRLGLRVFVFTNATLVTPRLAKLFSHIPPLERIRISVFGMKKESYEAVTRIAGSFDAARRGINLLLEKKIPFVVVNALLPPNKHEINEFENWAAFIPWMDEPPSYSMFFDLRCRRNNRQKNELIRRLRISPEDGLKVILRRKDAYAQIMKDVRSKPMPPTGDKLFHCGLGRGTGCVDAYGKFQPCMMLRCPSCIYDLQGGSLKDALVNFFPKLREIKTINPEYLARCAKCLLRYFCRQCPAKSWIEHGALDRPVEYLCEIAHVQARFFGLIRERQKSWQAKDGRGYPCKQKSI